MWCGIAKSMCFFFILDPIDSKILNNIRCCSGDILAWNLSKKSKQKWELFGEGNHSRTVFNICHYAENDVMVSVSMDRLVS